MYAKVIISLGSNTNQVDNMHKAKAAICHLLTCPKQTPDRWTEPIGIHSERFLNALVTGYTTLPCYQLLETLKRIEASMGDAPKSHQSGVVNIDLDLLLYGRQKKHLKDWNRPYVKEEMKSLDIL